jgi:hypothetical protein
MPNECMNTLQIVGEQSEIDAFYDAVAKDKKQEDIAILSTLYPVPAELKGKSKIIDSSKPLEERLEDLLIEKTEFTNEFDWCCAKWGSKWGDYDHDSLTKDGNYLYFQFITAWNPATEGFIEVSKQFPSLTFMLSYREDGCQLMGAYGFRNGEIIVHVEGEYPEYDEDVDNDDYNDLILEKEDECCDNVYSQLKFDDLRKGNNDE